MKIKLSTLSLVMLCIASLVGIGCDDEDGHDHGHDHDASVDEATVDGGMADAQAGATEPVYALVTQIFADDSANNQTYVIVTDSLDDGEALSIEGAGTEIAGRAIGAGPTGGGVIFIGGDSGPTVTRYDLQDDGTLEKGQTVSFIGEGVASIGEYGGQFHFVSDDKAYFFDGASAKLVVWNPEAMTVTGSESLAALAITDATLTFSASPLQVGDKLITFAGWRAGPQVPSEVGIVVVNTQTDDVTVIRDDRCGYVRDGALGPDGLVYVATEAYGAAVRRLGADNAAEPCMLRLDPDTLELEADYEVALNALSEGAPTGSLMRGPDGATFLRVFDESAFAIADDTHPRVLASAAAWKWARVTLGDEPSVSLLDTPASGGSVIMHVFGERFVAPIFSGSESTTLYDLTSDGLADEPAATVPGLVFSAVQLR